VLVDQRSVTGMVNVGPGVGPGATVSHSIGYSIPPPPRHAVIEASGTLAPVRRVGGNEIVARSMEFQAWGRYALADGGDTVQVPVALHLVRDEHGTFDLDDEQMENVLRWWPETLREVNEYYRSISAGLQLVWVPPVEGLFGSRLLTREGPDLQREAAFCWVKDECGKRGGWCCPQIEPYCSPPQDKLPDFSDSCRGNQGYKNRGILDVFIYRFPPGSRHIPRPYWAGCMPSGRAWVHRSLGRSGSVVIVYPYMMYEYDLEVGCASYTIAHEAGHAMGLAHTPLRGRAQEEQGWDAAGRSHNDPNNLMEKSCRCRPLGEDVILLTGQIYTMRKTALAVVGESCSSALEPDISAF